MINAASLSLDLADGKLPGLYLLLQKGFFIDARVGCTIRDFFLGQLGLDPEYIETRIPGIFLDGKPADHIDTAIVRDGSCLTLSGTMPGLAGMALRRGPLAVFRHSITHRETGDYCYAGKGYVHLKLLNLLMGEMGPDLLRKGLYLDSSDLVHFLGNLPAAFWQGCKTILLNGRKVPAELFREGGWQPESRLVKFTAVSR